MCWHECLWPIRSFSFFIQEHDEQPSVSTWCFSDSANRDRSWGPSCRCKNREEDYYHLLCSLFFSMKRKSSTCCRLLFLSCLCGRVFCHQPKLFVRSAPCVTMERLSLPFVVLGLAQDSCLGILVANCFDAARKLTMNVIQMAWNTNLQVSLNINLSKEKSISLDLSTVCTVIDFVRAVTITAMAFFSIFTSVIWTQLRFLIFHSVISLFSSIAFWLLSDECSPYMCIFWTRVTCGVHQLSRNSAQRLTLKKTLCLVL